MLALGWHGGWIGQGGTSKVTRVGVTGHDAAAVILRGHQLIAAIEEERLDRVKHSNAFPRNAIRYCLNEARATLRDVDAIAVDADETFLDYWVSQRIPASHRAEVFTGRQWIAKLFEDEFSVDISGKIHFCKHHLAHMHCAWRSSGFDEALLACLDGEGDGSSGLIAHCVNGVAKELRYLHTGLSLGRFYQRALYLLGYKLFDEYKVMGLAPYGDPAVYSSVFRKTYRLLPEGRYAIISDDEQVGIFREAGLIALARRRSEEFSRAHKNIAAALQEAIEAIVTHVVAHFRKVTGARNLCLSGGVAQNCAMAGRVLGSGIFDKVYVPPVAYDSGNALGAALAALDDHQKGSARAKPILSHAFHGTDVGDAMSIGKRLAEWKPIIATERVGNSAATAADLLAQGMKIAWVQGRSEFGARALGNRSILADPRPAANKDIINMMVKKREGYRPFAPSVLHERAREFFDLPLQAATSPFMTLVVRVRPEMRTVLGAVTHVDGTARVQTVSREDNEKYHELIRHFGERTGVPIVLNTSFNNNAEPIVDSVDDAVACYLTTGIDFLIIDEWLIRREPSAGGTNLRFLGLVPELPVTRKIIVSDCDSGELTYSLQSTVHPIFAEKSATISKAAYEVLTFERRSSTAQDRCTSLGIEDPAALEKLSDELYELWQRRIIKMLPRMPT